MKPAVESLERTLLVGYGAIAIALLTGFVTVFYVVFPELFGETSRRVFMPSLISYDLVFIAGLIAALRGFETVARAAFSVATAVIIYVSFLQTGGFPNSPILALALVPPMVFVVFYGARAGLLFSVFFVALLCAQWIGTEGGLVQLPNYSGNGPLVAFVVFTSAAFVMITFFSVVETENRRLRFRLSEERDRYETLAHTDGLTGLNNARAFHDAVDRHLAVGADEQRSFAAIYIDLDEFKPINDRFGHNVGDKVLKTAAERLLDVVGPSGFAARIGGDEFAVLFDKMPRDVDALCTAIRFAMEQPMPMGDVSHHVGTSIGHASFPSDGTDRRALLHAADSRMYADKLARTARRMAAAGGAVTAPLPTAATPVAA